MCSAHLADNQLVVTKVVGRHQAIALRVVYCQLLTDILIVLTPINHITPTYKLFQNNAALGKLEH